MPKDAILQPGAREGLDPFRVADVVAREKSRKGRRGPPSPRPGSNHPSPTHRSERSFNGAVRVAAAITIAISLGARGGGEGRPSHSCTSRRSPEAVAFLRAPTSRRPVPVSYVAVTASVCSPDATPTSVSGSLPFLPHSPGSRLFPRS